MSLSKKTIIKKIINRLKYTQARVFVLDKNIDGQYPHVKSDNKWKYHANGSLEEFLEIREGIDVEKLSQLYSKRIKRGDTCWVLCLEDNIAAYLWTSKSKHYVEPVNYWLHLDEYCFAIYDVYTHPLYRGKGCYKRLLYFVEEKMRQEGFLKVILYVMAHNIVAIHTQRNLGFEKVKMEITYRSFMGFIWKKKITTDYPTMSLLDEK